MFWKELCANPMLAPLSLLQLSPSRSQSQAAELKLQQARQAALEEEMSQLKQQLATKMKVRHAADSLPEYFQLPL